MILSNGRLLSRESPEMQMKEIPTTRGWDRTTRMPVGMKVDLNLARMPGDMTPEKWVAMCEAFGGCAYCRRELSVDACVMEHVTPVFCGGVTSVWNIVPACKLCNTRKGTRSLEEFLGRDREILEFVSLQNDCLEKAGLRTRESAQVVRDNITEVAGRVGISDLGRRRWRGGARGYGRNYR